MQLAKSRIDIGFPTNNAAPVLAFWQNEIGLPFDHVLPIRRGQRQHRHDLLGSVLKINELEAPIPDRQNSGYRELLIARDRLTVPRTLIDSPRAYITKVYRVKCGSTSGMPQVQKFWASGRRARLSY